MKYGIQTKVKSIYPYVKKNYEPSPKAKMRLKWMDYIDNGSSITQCSVHFDQPERTIRFWRKRYDKFNLKSLEDRSHRPKNCRYTLYDQSISDEIKKLRSKRVVGKEKIQVILKAKGFVIGQSKIQKIINREGFKRVKKKRPRVRFNRKHIYSVPRESLNQVGGLVYFDVKHLYLAGYNKVYQFTAIDHSTRMLFVKIYSSITSRCGKNFFEYVQGKLEYPISYAGSDNGSEFLGEFNKHLSDLKTEHVFSSPRSPKQNPYVERVIKTIIEEHYVVRGLAATLTDQQRELDDYVYYYNHLRPHHSLNLETPNQRYVKLTTKSCTI
jgi:transposase